MTHYWVKIDSFTLLGGTPSLTCSGNPCGAILFYVGCPLALINCNLHFLLPTIGILTSNFVSEISHKACVPDRRYLPRLFK